MNFVINQPVKKPNATDWRPFSSLTGFVRLVLLIDWDPIGILGYSGTMDEYDSYAAALVTLIESGATTQQVEEHLDGIMQTRMGVSGIPGASHASAQKLVKIYKAVRASDQWLQAEHARFR